MADPTRAQQAVGELITAAGALDWTDPRAAAQRAREALDELTLRPSLLGSLVDGIAASDSPGIGCESYPEMDKLVLWQSADRSVRLRLHVFFPGYTDRPHNHRWSFVSRIVRGGYMHAIFGTDTDVLREVRDGIEPRPRYLRREEAGGSYFLEHTLVHALSTDEVTVSLLLRGPAVKDQYFTVLPDDGSAGVADRLVWSRGAGQESAVEQQGKRITTAGLRRAVAVLDGIFGSG